MINSLKAKGFQSIQMVSLSTQDCMRATVEVIPGMQKDFAIDLIALNSSEIQNYFDGRGGDGEVCD